MQIAESKSEIRNLPVRQAGPKSQIGISRFTLHFSPFTVYRPFRRHSLCLPSDPDTGRDLHRPALHLPCHDVLSPVCGDVYKGTIKCEVGGWRRKSSSYLLPQASNF